MNLSQLSQPSFGVRFDGKHLPWPTNLGPEPKGWQDVVFLSYDEYPFLSPELWNEVVVSEHGQLYIEFHDLSLVKDANEKIGYKTEARDIKMRSMEEFTGQISFEGYLSNDAGDEDHYLVCSMTVIKGKLDSVEIHNSQAIDNKGRKKNVEKIQKQVRKMIERGSAPWYRYGYKPYKATVYAVYHILNFILAIPLWLLEKLVKLITPI